MEYIDLDTVHEPTEGGLVPVAWAHGIRQNFDYLIRPAYFVAKRTKPGHSNNEEREEVRALPDSTLEEITWTVVNEHSGDFFSAGEASPVVLSVPHTGMYFLSCKVFITFDDLTNAEARAWVAAIVSSDTDDDSYVLRSSGDLSLGHYYIGGLVRLSVGQSLRFAIYQTSGDNAHYGGYCSVIYMGGV